MKQAEAVQNYWSAAPPTIGKCAKCHTEILASHPYARCTKCDEPLPYSVNMERRPIMYGTIKVTPASLAGESIGSRNH